MFDPKNLVGKEVRALDDEDYGHRVLNYYPENQYYVVETIYWDSGKLVNKDYLESPIKKDDLYNKYDVYSARESLKVSDGQ
jgi:hypothetical protein